MLMVRKDSNSEWVPLIEWSSRSVDTWRIYQYVQLSETGFRLTGQVYVERYLMRKDVFIRGAIEYTTPSPCDFDKNRLDWMMRTLNDGTVVTSTTDYMYNDSRMIDDNIVDGETYSSFIEDTLIRLKESLENDSRWMNDIDYSTITLGSFVKVVDKRTAIWVVRERDEICSLLQRNKKADYKMHVQNSSFRAAVASIEKSYMRLLFDNEWEHLSAPVIDELIKAEEIDR